MLLLLLLWNLKENMYCTDTNLFPNTRTIKIISAWKSHFIHAFITRELSPYFVHHVGLAMNYQLNVQFPASESFIICQGGKVYKPKSWELPWTISFNWHTHKNSLKCVHQILLSADRIWINEQCLRTLSLNNLPAGSSSPQIFIISLPWGYTVTILIVIP